MLHYLDDLDSKMEAMRAQLEREADLGGPWTSYNASLGRPLLDSRKFLEGEKAPAAKANAEDSGTPPVAAATAKSSGSEAPIVDLFSEQKA